MGVLGLCVLRVLHTFVNSHLLVKLYFSFVCGHRLYAEPHKLLYLFFCICLSPHLHFSKSRSHRNINNYSTHASATIGIYIKLITWNPLDGILPRSIGSLSLSLGKFIMSDSNISGSIPEQVSNLTNLTSKNEFSLEHPSRSSLNH